MVSVHFVTFPRKTSQSQDDLQSLRERAEFLAHKFQCPVGTPNELKRLKVLPDRVTYHVRKPGEWARINSRKVFAQVGLFKSRQTLRQQNPMFRVLKTILDQGHRLDSIVDGTFGMGRDALWLADCLVYLNPNEASVLAFESSPILSELGRAALIRWRSEKQPWQNAAQKIELREGECPYSTAEYRDNPKNVPQLLYMDPMMQVPGGDQAFGAFRSIADPRPFTEKSLEQSLSSIDWVLVKSSITEKPRCPEYRVYRIRAQRCRYDLYSRHKFLN